MRREALVFALAGTFFGLIVGWMLGSQYAPGPRGPLPAAQTAQGAPVETASGSAPAKLDDTRVAELRAAAQQNPQDAQARAQLGNLYFDAERYDDAVTWYEAALQLDPRNPDVSTDLGISYYYTDQTDRALKQFEYSLSVSPNHTKTMLNMGIVRAFGKQDLKGAAEAWERVLAIAPDSPDGRTAKQALEGMRSAHPPSGGAAPPDRSGGR